MHAGRGTLTVGHSRTNSYFSHLTSVLQYLLVGWSTVFFCSIIFCLMRPFNGKVTHSLETSDKKPTLGSDLNVTCYIMCNYVFVICSTNLGDVNFRFLKVDLFCRNVPFRVRVRLARLRNEDEDSTNKLYTLVTHVSVATFKGLQTENVSTE